LDQKLPVDPAHRCIDSDNPKQHPDTVQQLDESLFSTSDSTPRLIKAKRYKSQGC
jgi:hypothetical protein